MSEDEFTQTKAIRIFTQSTTIETASSSDHQLQSVSTYASKPPSQTCHWDQAADARNVTATPETVSASRGPPGMPAVKTRTMILAADLLHVSSLMYHLEVPHLQKPQRRACTNAAPIWHGTRQGDSAYRG